MVNTNERAGPKLVVFAYNFPHRKTQDFLLRLFLEGYEIDCVLAMDPVKLNIPPSEVRTKVRHTGYVHPSEVADRIGARYEVAQHDSDEALAILDELEPEVGIIAGARILKAAVIEQFSTGIINYHPGLIPDARGLDAMLWSVRNDVPMGVTAHLIDERVDAGRILIKHPIELKADDTVFDLSERLYEIQLDLIDPAIKAAVQAGETGDSLPTVGKGKYNRKMPGDLERETLDMIPDYLERRTSD